MLQKHPGKVIVAFLFLVAFVVGWSVFLLLVGAETIVSAIGVENTYIVLLLVSLFGGVSSFGGPAYTAMLITFSAGGSDPLLLAVCSGIGVSVGDTLYFILGSYGIRALKHEKTQERVKKVKEWLDKKPAWSVPFVTYMLVGFTPIPNDILTIALGATRRPYVPIIIALVLGNMTLSYLVATFSQYLAFLV
jgi:membrane protein YqaA with SNARE-associated domain